MSDFAGALFGGAAALQADESFAKWRALWQEDERRKLQAEEAERNRAHATNMQANEQAFNELMAKKAEEFQLGLLTRQEAFSLGVKALDMQPNMSIEGQQLMRDHLKSINSQFLPMFESGMRQGWFKEPQAALDLLQQVHSAPLGTKFDPLFVRQAATVGANLLGLEGDEREEFFASYDAALEKRAEEGATLDDIGMALANIELPQAQANLEQTRSDTRQSDATTQSIITNTAHAVTRMGWETADRDLFLEEWKLKIEGLASSIRGQDLANVQQEIINGRLTRRLEAEISNLLLQNQALSDDHELHAATFEDIVATVAAEADLTMEEARFAVATSSVREALLAGELDLAQANIAAAWKSIEVADSQLLNDEASRAQLAQGMLFEVIANGDSTLMGTMGADLLKKMGYADTTIARLVKEWGARMDEGLSNATLMERAATDMAIADADLARSKATVAKATEGAAIKDANAQADWNAGAIGRDERDFAEGVRQFDVDQSNRVSMANADRAESGRQHDDRTALGWAQLELDRWSAEQGVRIDEARLAQMAGAGGGAGGGLPAPGTTGLTDFYNDVQDSTGIGLDNVHANTKAARDLGNLAAAANDIAAPLEAAPKDPLVQQQVRQALLQLLATPLGYDIDSPPTAAMMLRDVRSRANASRLEAVSNIVTYLNASAERFNQPLPPDALGLTPDDYALYRAAGESVGLINAEWEGEEAAKRANPELQNDIRAVYARADQLITDTAPTATAGLEFGAASAIYNTLASEFPPEVLAEAGLSSVEALMAAGAPERAATAVRQGEQAASAMERLGVPADTNLFEDARARESLVRTVQNEGNKYLAFANQALEGVSDISPVSNNLGNGLFSKGGLFGPTYTPEPTPRHLELGAQLIGTLSEAVTPEELVNAGVLGQTPYGDYYLMNPSAARALLVRLAEERYAEGAALVQEGLRAR